MAGSFLSDSWYRVAPMRPCLRRHARITRQRQRGKAWYVLYDPLTNRSQRFPPAVWLLLSQLDGRCTVDAAWQRALAELGDDAPSQDEVINLLSQLHKADLLLTLDSVPDIDELLRRRRKQQRSRWLSSLVNPMSIRIPLWDPDRFLERSVGWLRPLFGWQGLLLWLAIVLPACFAAGEHWDELTGNLSDRLLSGSNLLCLALVFPVVKLMHELGHGWAVKAHGGQVHEAGLMLIMFAPTPYVDASASAEFRSKWYRAFVAAAGMLTELLLAALAMYVWLVVEPGVARTVAFNVMIVAGASTLVFNGNPLLRFDGYYILADLIEIPNLAQRANHWYGWLVRRYAFGDREAERPGASAGEARWFVLYAPAALVYRSIVSITMALFIATQYFFAGVLLALVSLVQLALVPLFKLLRQLATSPLLARRRARAWTVSAAATGAFCLFAAAVPLPRAAVTQGVVWVPARAEVRAAGTGFVQDMLASAPGATVGRRQPLFRQADPALAASHAGQQAKVAELEVQLLVDRAEERARGFLTEQVLERERAILLDLERRMAELVTVAPDAGRVVIARAADLPGRHVKRGELLGYVLAAPPRLVRAVVVQDDIGLVRGRLESVTLRLGDRAGQDFGARVVREVPGGSEALPSRALMLDGGGELVADPRDPEGVATLDKVFQFDIEVPAMPGDVRIGTRAYVKFRFLPEPLFEQAQRRLRQLFLSRLHV